MVPRHCAGRMLPPTRNAAAQRDTIACEQISRVREGGDGVAAVVVVLAVVGDARAVKVLLQPRF